MIRRIDDFAEQWEDERQETLKLLRMLTDDSLSQAIVPNGRTLGFLGWHLAASIPEMLGKAGLQPDGPSMDEPVPAAAAAIAEAYDRASASLVPDLRSRWSDDTLTETVEMYGYTWTRGFVLELIIRHEAHHRGQMTVLMRQAGLPVHGVYGPSSEEWVAMGMQPLA